MAETAEERRARLRSMAQGQEEPGFFDKVGDFFGNLSAGAEQQDEMMSSPTLNPAPAAAPAPVPAPAPAGGGLSGPDQNIGPEAQAAQGVEEAIKTSQEVVQRTPPKVAQQVSEQFEDMGVDPDVAFEEFREEFGKKYEIPDMKLTKQQKGLYLMDFGMRLMAASGNWQNTLGGAIGQAGMGTAARMEQDYNTQVQQANAANQAADAYAMERTKMAMEAAKPADVIEAQSGLYVLDEAGRISPTGLQQDPAGRRGGRAPKEIEIILGMYKRLYPNADERTLLELARGRPRLSSMGDAMKHIRDMKAALVESNLQVQLPDGSMKRWKDLDTKDMTALAREEMKVEMEATMSSLGAEGGGAL